ncbi:MAG: DUF664 domain-containing protein [Ignavibacteriae bacterium]|nr:MAG: DUF664 domain-containing protein [Ignavibacteriota bacterium]
MAKSDFLITDIEGYTTEISRLVSMMNYARQTTLWAIEGLTTQQLDFILDEKANTIGTLLMHITGTEFYFQKHSFEKRELTPEEDAEWHASTVMGKEGWDKYKGYSLEYYLNEMKTMRDKTLDKLKTVNDEWLYEEFPFWNNQPVNNYFLWFHVFEDEINHRGQINLIKKRIPK